MPRDGEGYVEEQVDPAAYERHGTPTICPQCDGSGYETTYSGETIGECGRCIGIGAVCRFCRYALRSPQEIEWQMCASCHDDGVGDHS
jgi:hypothetical protein